MSSTTPRLRIGGVPYGVGVRLLDGLDDLPDVALVRDVPARLIRSLRGSELDAALVSSIEGFRQPGYRAPSDIGIAAHGPVKSVRAFFQKPAAEVRSVGVDVGSEASVALLRVLLEGPLGGPKGLVFERIEPTTRPDDLPHDVVLLIGDIGLEADPGRREPLDLGLAWQEWTGLPFVFALWLIRPGADAGRLAPLLRAARERSRGHGRRASEGGVHYDLGAAERQGLMRFGREATALGLAEPGVSPVLLEAPAGGEA